MLVSLHKYDLVVQYERGGRMILADTLSRDLYKGRECLYWTGMTGEISMCQHVKRAESTNRVKHRKHSPATKHLVVRGSSLQQTYLS